MHTTVPPRGGAAGASARAARRLRRALPLALLLPSLPLLPASAQAATLHAVPEGSGATCTAERPCLLQQALQSAQEGDGVVVHAGTHQLVRAGFWKRSITLEGVPGEPRPTVELQAIMNECGLALGHGSTVRHLRLRPTSVRIDGLCLRGRTLVERVVVWSSRLDVDGLVLSDADSSVVRDTSARMTENGWGRAIVVAGSVGVTLQNVSALAVAESLGIEAGQSEMTSVELRSSWVGNQPNAIKINCTGAIGMSVTVSHSAIGNVSTGGCAYVAGAGIVGLDGTNVVTDADGVLRPRAGSASTLAGAGSLGEHAGSRDLDGKPRVLGGKIDAGAIETPAAPTIGTAGATRVTATGARLSAAVGAQGAEQLQVRFELGTTSAYGIVVPATIPQPGGRGFFIPSASAQAEGLRPSTRYRVRAVGSNEFGQETAGAVAYFTTAAAPAGGGGTGGGGGAGGGGAGGGTGPGGGSGGPGGPGGTGGGAKAKAPSCRVAIVRTRRAGRVVVRGRCSKAATLRLGVVRGGRRAPARYAVRVPAGKRFAKTIRVGRLATARRAVNVRAVGPTGAKAKLLRLKIRRR